MKYTRFIRHFVAFATFYTAIYGSSFAQSTNDSLSSAGSLSCNVASLQTPACVLLAGDAKRKLIGGYELTEGEDGLVVGDTVPLRFTSFNQADERATHSAVLLIDNSTNAREDGPANERAARTLEAVKQAVRSTAQALPQNTRISVMVYSDRITKSVAFGATPRQIEDAVAALDFTGLQTQTFKALGEALTALDSQDSTTKSIYLFTDGLSEDDNTRNEVTEAARSRNVPINVALVHFLPVGEPKRGAVSSTYSALAAQTSGVAVEGTTSVATAFAAAMKAKQNSSGIIELLDPAPTWTTPVRIIVEMERPTARDVVPLTADLQPPQPVPGSEDPKGEIEAEPDVNDLPDWAIPAGAGAVLLLLLLALWLLLRSRRNAEDDQSDAEFEDEPSDDPDPDDDAFGDEATRQIQGVESASGPILARLVMTSDGQQYDVRRSKISIGRSNDNDMVLKDDSISRFHSELHLTRDGHFAVTDLDSLNKTFVNGQDVKTTALNSGDRLKLGEVEMTFHKVG